MRSGILQLGVGGYWEVKTGEGDQFELTHGAICEVNIDGEWKRTRLEEVKGKGLVPKAPGIEFVHGLEIRVKGL